MPDMTLSGALPPIAVAPLALRLLDRAGCCPSVTSPVAGPTPGRSGSRPTAARRDPARGHDPNGAPVREIDVTELQQRLASGTAPALVDVREAGEFATGHVPSARNVPLSEFVDRLDEVTTLPGEVLLICESGLRSAQVAAWLGQQGYDAVNVAGGTGAWRSRGWAVETPAR